MSSFFLSLFYSFTIFTTVDFMLNGFILWLIEEIPFMLLGQRYQFSDSFGCGTFFFFFFFSFYKLSNSELDDVWIYCSVVAGSYELDAFQTKIWKSRSSCGSREKNVQYKTVSARMYNPHFQKSQNVCENYTSTQICPFLNYM